MTTVLVLDSGGSPSVLRRLAAVFLVAVLLVCPYLCRAETGGCCATSPLLGAEEPPGQACCGHCDRPQEPRPAPSAPAKLPCHLPCLCNGAVLGSETPDAGALLGGWMVTEAPTTPPLPAAIAVEVWSDAFEGLSTGGRTLCIAHSLWLC